MALSTIYPNETAPLEDGAAYHAAVDHSGMTLSQVAAAGGRISRLRLLTEIRWGYGMIVDISYCHAVVNGKTVAVVGYPALNLMRNAKRDLIEWAKSEGVYAKAVGLLDEANWSVLS